MTEEIIIEIKVSEVAGKLAETTAQIQKLKKENKELDKTTAEGAEAFAKNTAAIKQLTVQEKVLSAQIAATTKSTVDQNASMKEQEGELDKLKLQYASLTSEMKDSSGGKAMKKSIDELDASVKANRASIGDHQRSIGNYEKSTISLKQELKNIVVEMANLSMANQENSDRFRELQERGGELKDTLSDISARLKNAGSDTKNIDQLVGAFTALGSVVQVAEGSMQLFGAESEDIQRGIQKMVAIQGILNGVQEIGNALQKESAFMMGVLTVKEKALQAAKITTTAIMRTFGVTSAVAMGIATAGITLLISGVVLLISNWDKLTASFTESGRELDRLTSYQKVYNKLADMSIAATNKRARILEASGAKESDIMKAQGKGLVDLFELRKQELEVIEKKIALNKETEEDVKRAEELELELSKIRTDVEVLNIEGKRKIAEEEKAIRDKREAAEKEAAEKQKVRVENSISIYQQLQDAVLANTKKGVELQIEQEKLATARKIEELKKQTNLTAKGIQDRNELIKQLQIESENKILDIRKQSQDESIKKRYDDELAAINAEIAIAGEGTRKELDLKLQALDKAHSAALDGAMLTDKELLALDTKYLQDKEALTDEYNSKIQAKELEVAKTNLDNELAIAQLKAEDDLALQQQALEAQRVAEVTAAEKTGADVLLINEKYRLQDEQLQAQSEARKIGATRETLNNLSAAFDKNTIAYKATASTQALIDTYAAAQAAFKSGSAISPIIGAISAAAAVAAGLKNVAAINSIKTPKAQKFATGGVYDSNGTNIVGGNSFTGDNINARLNSREMIINPSDQAALFKFVQNVPSSGGIDYNKMAAAMSAVRPVVSVSEINSVNSRVSTLETLGSY